MEFGEVAELVIRTMGEIVTADDAGGYVHEAADRINAAQVLLNAAQSLDMQRQQDEQTALQLLMFEEAQRQQAAMRHGPGLVVPMPVIGGIGN